jgi:hypothetical protein
MKTKILIACLLSLQSFLIYGEVSPQDSILYADFECDGAFNNADVAIPFTRIENENGQLLDITNSIGEFVLSLDAGVSYAVSTSEIFGFSATPIYINPNNDTTYSVNLGVCPESFINNLKIEVVPVLSPAQGNDFRYDICVTNMGTQSDDVKVRFVPNFGDVVQIIDLGGAALQGNALVWDVDGLPPFQRTCFSVILHASDLSEGEGFSFTANTTYIDNGISDNFPSDNQIVINEVVQQNHEWNAKTVSRTEIDFLEIEIFESLPLEYEISFGLNNTDTLDQLTIQDTLSSLLDLSTFQLTSVSHDYDFSIEENIITWTFYNLNFDILQDEIHRSGLIRYRVNTIENPIITDTIFNTANFFADSTNAYSSNTTVTSFYLCPEVVEILGDAHFCASTGGNFLPGISDYDTFSWILDGAVVSSNDSLISLMTTPGNHQLGLIIVNEACTVTGLLPIVAETQPTLELNEANISNCNEVSISGISNAILTWFEGNVFVIADDTLVITSNGNYAAIASNSCGSISEEVTLIVPEGPEDVTIFNSEGLLSLSEEAIQYTWFIDGNILPNSDIPTWEASESGSYSALLEFASGCQINTSEISITIHITEQEFNDIFIYPNPTTHGTIQFSILGEHIPQRISVCDLQGKEVKVIQPTSRIFSTELNELQSGVYLIKMNIDGRGITRRLTII